MTPHLLNRAIRLGRDLLPVWRINSRAHVPQVGRHLTGAAIQSDNCLAAKLARNGQPLLRSSYPIFFAATFIAACTSILAQPPAVEHSDIVFMFTADAKTYEEYGGTIMGWSESLSKQALNDAHAAGMRFFGSVGMVTEFPRYYDRFPTNYEQGLCRDLNGAPVKVPWQTDHQYKGIPYWWCCTQQPLFRQFLRERVAQTIAAGADGLHIDDHQGTAGALRGDLHLDVCFCDACIKGFQEYLAGLPSRALQGLAIRVPREFNFRTAMKSWLETHPGRHVQDHPLWLQWQAYQYKAAAKFLEELHEAANSAAGHPIPMAVNAAILWPHQLNDYKTVNLYLAETTCDAKTERPSDTPLVAYRLAEALSRPYVATATGEDWAFINAHNLPGLALEWIVEAYAAGQHFVVPNHQWCYTPEKGTHWYNGPKERFVPFYNFIHQHADLFNGFSTFTDLGVVIPYSSLNRDPKHWFALCDLLAEANISYGLYLGGDNTADIALSAQHPDCKNLLIPERNGFLPSDKSLIDDLYLKSQVSVTVEQALRSVHPSVRVSPGAKVRAFPRIKAGSAVVHLVNLDYHPDTDRVSPVKALRVTVDLHQLGLPDSPKCDLLSPDGGPVSLTMSNGTVELPALGAWGLLYLH